MLFKSRPAQTWVLFTLSGYYCTVLNYFISAVHILTIVLNHTDERICNHTEIVHSKLFLLK